MGVDEQERIAGRAVFRRNRKTVRPGGLPEGANLAIVGGLRHRRTTVKSFESTEVHPFDVSPDAALAEGQRHPGFEVREHPRGDFGMSSQVVVQPVRPRVHQALEPRWSRIVLASDIVGRNKQLHAQIAPDLIFALGLGEATHSIQKVHLDAIEVILGLCVDHAEDGVGVGRAMDVGNALVVSNDRNVGGSGLQARKFRIDGGAASAQDQQQAGCQRGEEELLHCGILQESVRQQVAFEFHDVGRLIRPLAYVADGWLMVLSAVMIAPKRGVVSHHIARRTESAARFERRW